MEQNPLQAASTAEFLYVRWLLGREHGAKVPFEELCALHPDAAEELREWHGTQSRLRTMLQAAGLGEMEAERQERLIASAVQRDLMHFGAPARRYRLGAEIRSSCGRTVHDAEDALTGRNVLCTLLRCGSEQRRNLADLRRRLRLSGRLDHPCIASILDAGLDADGTPYFVTGRLPACDLRSLLREGSPVEERPDMERVLEILARSAEAVASAHTKGVVHTRINPRLVHVGANGEVLVSGWEDAFMQADHEPDDTEAQLRWGLFAPATDVLPTPYLPPEARKPNHSPTPAWDVFAFGILLKEALALVGPGRGCGEEWNPDRIALLAEWDSLARLTTEQDAAQRVPDGVELVRGLRSLVRAAVAATGRRDKGDHPT